MEEASGGRSFYECVESSARRLEVDGVVSVLLQPDQRGPVDVVKTTKIHKNQENLEKTSHPSM